MTLKAILAVIAAAAIIVGFCLPALHGRTRAQAEPRSQIDQIEVGRR